MPKFDDIIDLLEAVHSQDMSDELETWEEVTPAMRAKMRAEARQRHAEMSDEEKLRRAVGEAIFERLLALHMRQIELARRLGKGPSYVSRVVRGQENLGLDSLCQIARALECEPGDLLPAASLPARAGLAAAK